MAAIAVITPDLQPIVRRIARAEKLLGSPTPILKAFGVVTLGWIGQTFALGGRPAWKPLTPWTLAGRRQGKGKSQSAKPLENNGVLRQSFDYRTEERSCVVFSNNPVAVFQQYGTRGPYEIRAKAGKALALPMMGLGGQRSLAGLGRSTPTGGGGFLVQAGKNAPTRVKARQGKRIVPFKNVSFFMHVTHPGLVPRPMLPTQAQAIVFLDAAAKRLIDLALERRA